MTVAGFGATDLSTAWCHKMSEKNGLCEQLPEPSQKRRRLDHNTTLPPLSVPFNVQLSQYQDTSLFGNQVSTTTQGTASSRRDTDNSQTQSQDVIFSGPIQRDGEAALMPLASTYQQYPSVAYSSGIHPNQPTGRTSFTNGVGTQGLTSLSMST